MPRGTEPVNRVQVLGRRIAFVRFPAIAGMAPGEAIHQIVADRLGDHRRRRDRVTARITVDDRFVLAAELRTGQAVDEHPRGREAEPMEGALHRENRGPPDVVAIDLVHAGGTEAAVRPRFSRMRAALPASRRRKYSLARRTRPFRISPISAIEGACSGKIRSTPTPAEILRTVNVSLMPPPRRAMQIPSNACRRSFSPSRTRTMTRTVSPGAKAGISVFRPSRSTALSFSITIPRVSTKDLVCVLA